MVMLCISEIKNGYIDFSVRFWIFMRTLRFAAHMCALTDAGQTADGKIGEKWKWH